MTEPNGPGNPANMRETVTTVHSSQTRFQAWDLMQVGQTLQYLQRVTARKRIGPSSGDPAGVLDQIRELLELLEQLELTESDQAARDWLDPLIHDLEDLLLENPLAQLGEAASLLREIAADLTVLVRDEASRRSIFVVPYDRYGYAEKLLNDPVAHFRVDPSHFSPPPQHALDDLEEATACYAIGRPAAAILFSLRATEAFVRQFYCEVVGARPERATLGPLISTIKLPVVGCETIANKLGPVKKRRDGAMHAGHRKPDEWDDRAARWVMAQCGTAIRAMWDHLTNRLERGQGLNCPNGRDEEVSNV